MDPALQELLAGDPDEEVEAIIRLEPGDPAPPGVRLIARFGEVATCRVRRGDVPAARAEESVRSLKAPRLMKPEPAAEDPAEPDGQPRRTAGLEATGRGVVIGVIDWGCDVAHRDFRRADGSTRLLALWDQRAPADARSPRPYGYGRVHAAADIDRALRTGTPYASLGYHPGDGDDRGTHGTHVLSIAADMAPEAELVFVHLTNRGGTGGLGNLGDSVTILEAVHFIDNVAGERPCVINASVGRHGGPHDGSTLVERALDQLVAARPGRCVVQSCGNYYEQSIHASGRLLPGDRRTLRWMVDQADVTPNELEIWYSGRDTVGVEVSLPGQVPAVSVPPDGRAPLLAGDREVGRAYHRRADPNNGHHHVDVFLDAGGPAGTWDVVLTGTDVVDGRFDAWVERDATCHGCQSRFERSDTEPRVTTGTICNGLRTIAVGAYDPHDPAWPVAPFSSCGPTRDGRQKPDVLAPGVRIRGARSAPPGADQPVGDYVTKSGTSMAAPYVAGAVACMYQAAGRPLPIQEVRVALAGTAIPPPPGFPAARVGAGYADVAAAVAAVAPALTARREALMDTVGGVPEAPVLASLDAAAVFDAVAYRTGSPGADLAERYEVVAIPGEVPADPILAGDVLIRRVLGEGDLAEAIALGGGELGPAVGPDGRLAPDRLVLRPRGPGLPRHENVDATEQSPHTCRPGEGPPAPEPDPTGRGPHPLIMRGTSAVSSRRPSVGYAQSCLNEWMARRLAGGTTCVPGAEVERFVSSAFASLRAKSQLPLVVDCRFGENTERATKAFQACQGIGRDGKIGPVTWPLLVRFAPPAVPTPPPPVPPTSRPTPPPPAPPVPPDRPPADDAVRRWRELMGPACRDGNEVVALIDAGETFRRLHEAITTATGPEHFIYMLCWWLDLDEPLAVPTTGPWCPGPQPHGGASTLRSLLTAASARQVQVRAMLWDFAFSKKNNAETEFINGLPTGAAILDNHQFMAGAQHQKLIVVKGATGLIAFCGGVDINCDRMCPQGGCPPGGVYSSLSGSSQGAPLHDVHCRITGPAVRDLLDIFVKRWFTNAEHEALDKAKGHLLGIKEPIPPAVGNTVVRIGQTYNARATVPATPTMPAVVNHDFRDRSVQDILLRAIYGARRFVYIEDQYMISLCAAEAIRSVLSRIDHVTILISASELLPGLLDLPRKWLLRKRFVDHIRNSPHAGKVRIFVRCDPAQTKETQRFSRHTYVHSKILIADDELAVIGSANLNRRGWEHDTELVAAVIGPTGGGLPLARSLRIRLWAHHLQAPVATVADPIASKGLWLTGANRRVCPYDPQADTDGNLESLIPIDTFIDPPFPTATAPCCTIHGPSCPGAAALAPAPTPALASTETITTEQTGCRCQSRPVVHA